MISTDKARPGVLLRQSGLVNVGKSSENDDFR
jgi:hypothetical protein